MTITEPAAPMAAPQAVAPMLAVTQTLDPLAVPAVADSAVVSSMAASLVHSSTTVPPTLADVARAAGVSSATASRVLTGSARVKPQTRRRVEQAMSSLGYVRNRAPRSTDSRRAGSIALVVCEENVKVFADPFFARMLWCVSKALSNADLQLVLLTLYAPRDYHTVARYLRSGHVDGALIVSMHGKAQFDFGSLGIPLVLCGRPVSGAESLF